MARPRSNEAAQDEAPKGDEAAAVESESAGTGEAPAYNRERLIIESQALADVPPHVMAGALSMMESGDDPDFPASKEELTAEEAASLVQRWLARSTGPEETTEEEAT